MLALNRGEQNKVLTVKLTVPTKVEKQFLAHLHKTWAPSDAPGKSGCPVCRNYGITAVTNNTRPIAFKKTPIKLRFGGRQS